MHVPQHHALCLVCDTSDYSIAFNAPQDANPKPGACNRRDKMASCKQMTSGWVELTGETSLVKDNYCT